MLIDFVLKKSELILNNDYPEFGAFTQNVHTFLGYRCSLQL